jgi:hypothetical protein
MLGRVCAVTTTYNRHTHSAVHGCDFCSTWSYHRIDLRSAAIMTIAPMPELNCRTASNAMTARPRSAFRAFAYWSS